MAALVAVVTVWHASEASQHLLTDRDPGVYNTAARWLAREGTLLVDPAVGPFAGRADLVFEEQGWNLDDEGRLEPQFLHLLAVVLAGAQLLGGDRLLLVAPAVIAGAALLAFFAFARRVVRPWWGLVATAGLAACLPWVHVSRDAFSEPLAVVLLFGGLALLWDAVEDGSWRRAGVAGLVLGGVSMARVEGFVALLPLVASGIVLLAGALRHEACVRADRVRLVGALAGGLAVTTALAAADLLFYGTWYLRDLRDLLRPVGVGLLVVLAIGAGALALLERRSHRERPRVRPLSGEDGGGGVRSTAVRQPGQALGWFAAGVVLVAAGVAWFVRPVLSTVTGASSAAIAVLEGNEGRAAEGVRRYSEDSVLWLGWYLGPAALALGFLGLAVVVRRLVAHQPRDPRLVPFVTVLVVVSSLYLWRPSIVPDHVWAMRRYTIVTIPGLLLLAALAGQALVDQWRERRRTAIATLTGLAVTGVVIAFPISTLLPVAGATTQDGLLAEVEEICAAIGPTGAVVVLPGAALELVAAQALRSFCGVPVAIAGPQVDASAVADLASAWADGGRELHLVGADAARVEALAGRDAELVVVVPNDQQLEATLTQRPDELVAVPVTLVLADASPGAPPQQG